MQKSLKMLVRNIGGTVEVKGEMKFQSHNLLICSVLHCSFMRLQYDEKIDVLGLVHYVVADDASDISEVCCLHLQGQNVLVGDFLYVCSTLFQKATGL